MCSVIHGYNRWYVQFREYLCVCFLVVVNQTNDAIPRSPRTRIGKSQEAWRKISRPLICVDRSASFSYTVYSRDVCRTDLDSSVPFRTSSGERWLKSVAHLYKCAKVRFVFYCSSKSCKIALYRSRSHDPCSEKNLRVFRRM